MLSDEENEAVCIDFIEYCQKVAMIPNKNYIQTFDHIYSDDIFKPSKNSWTNYIKSLSIFAGMIILLIII